MHTNVSWATYTRRLMPAFEYRAPELLDDAIAVLREYGRDARILAGGTDLMIAMRERGLRPGCLVDLRRIPGLATMSLDADGTLRLGALVPVRDVEVAPSIRSGFPLLAAAAGMLASVQVRSLATVGGNLCNASPAADLAPPLLVLDATATAVGPNGSRDLALSSFFAGPGRTTLDGEILVALSVPAMPARARATYIKHGPRSAMDIALVGVAVLAVPDPTGRTFDEVRIALGSVAPTPIRATAAEAALRGAPISVESIERAADIAAGASSPISDVRGSADYRRAMVRALVRRALTEVSL